MSNIGTYRSKVWISLCTIPLFFWILIEEEDKSVERFCNVGIVILRTDRIIIDTIKQVYKAIWSLWVDNLQIKIFDCDPVNCTMYHTASFTYYILTQVQLFENGIVIDIVWSSTFDIYIFIAFKSKIFILFRYLLSAQQFNLFN